jgi:hypothetical protein
MTSVVRHTPSNAARGSFALSATTAVSAALATDKYARTFRCFVMGISFAIRVSGGARERSSVIRRRAGLGV